MTQGVVSFGRRIWHTRLRDVVRGRIDGRLDWRLAVRDSELPAPARAAVVDTVQRTRLWQVEKAEVATELIAHFQDGLAAGRSAEELAETFGDVCTAARLIRRAKRRNRPLVWHVCRWMLWTVIGLIVLYLLLLLRFVWGRPDIRTNYLEIVNRRAAAVPADEAAWPIYREALFELGMRNTPPAPIVNEHVKSRPGEESWPAAKEFFEQHQAAIAALRQAASLPGLGYESSPAYWPVDANVFGPDLNQGLDKEENRPLFGVLLMHVQYLGTAAEVLIADARRAMEAGDGVTAREDVVALFHLSEQVQEYPCLVTGLVAIHLQNQGYELLESLLAKGSDFWSDDDLQVIAHTIAAAGLDWEWWLFGERMAFHDIVQRLYTDDGQGDGRLTDEGMARLKHFQGQAEGIAGLASAGATSRQPSLWSGVSRTIASFTTGDLEAAAAPLLVASRQEVLAKYDSMMSRFEVRANTPLWQRVAEDPLVEIRNWSVMDAFRFLPISLLMPALQASDSTLQSSRGQREGVLLGLALELYRREHGDWPASLDELAPRYLPEIPRDRLTGEPLHYRIIDDGPVIYSVGVDRDDDGGAAPNRSEGINDRNHLVGPVFWDEDAVTSDQHDGDWVLWSPIVDQQERSPGQDAGLPERAAP